MTNTVICSHEADLDGIYSAAIALMKYKNADISFYNYGHDNFKKMFEHIFSETNINEEGTVIISDLGINTDLIKVSKEYLDKIKTNGWDVVWVDHHPWPEGTDILNPLIRKIHDNSGKKCASDLMYDHFMQDNSLALELKKMAHSMDFMTSQQYVTPIPELIQFYRNMSDVHERLVDLVYKSVRGILWDTEMQKDYGEYLLIRDMEREKALDSIKIKDILGFKVAFVLISKYLQSSLFSDYLFKQINIDLILLYNKEGKVSIRRKTDLVSCSKIASFLKEGGGHEFAAGARLSSNFDSDEKCREELENAVTRAISDK